MAKAILTNRIFLETNPELQAHLLRSLTYKIPQYRDDLPPKIITNARIIREGLMSIPSGRMDLIPDDYEIINRRFLDFVDFPEFKGELRINQAAVHDHVASDCFINANTSWGKAQPAYSKIRVPGGWKTMEDISIGDTVKTPCNNTATVINKFFHKNKPIYRVTFIDGRTVDACEDHLWNYYTWPGNKTSKIKTGTTKDLINNLNKRLAIPTCNSIDDNKYPHIIHPYILGFLLGDGGLTTRVTFSTADQELVDKIRLLLPKDHVVNYMSNYDYSITGLTGVIGSNLIKLELDRLGLLGKNSLHKFIPNEYKFTDIESKIQLLQGLFDADGSVDSDGYIEYSSSSKLLINDIMELIYSLGGTANLQYRNNVTYEYKGSKKLGKISYRFRPSTLTFSQKQQLFSLQRKKSRVKDTNNSVGRVSVKSIEYLNNQDCWCIEIDSKEHLYLTDNYIVTHNTFTALKIAGKLEQKTLIIVHTLALRDQWIAECEKVYGFTPGVIGSGKFNTNMPITIGNIQSLYRVAGDKISKSFGTVIVDECHHIPSRTFSALIDANHAFYKIGLSASAKRKDGLHLLFPDYFSPKVFKPQEENRMVPTIHRVKLPIRVADGEQPWAIKINDLAENEVYQRTIALIAASYASKGHKVLVLSSRTKLVERAAELTPKSVLVTGATKDRAIQLQKMRDGSHTVLYGSLSIFAEGVSENYLSCLIIATPINNEPLLDQLIGRVIRKQEGKIKPVVVMPLLMGKTVEKQQQLMKGYFMRAGYEVIDL